MFVTSLVFGALLGFSVSKKPNLQHYRPYPSTWRPLPTWPTWTPYPISTTDYPITDYYYYYPTYPWWNHGGSQPRPPKKSPIGKNPVRRDGGEEAKPPCPESYSLYVKGSAKPETECYNPKNDYHFKKISGKKKTYILVRGSDDADAKYFLNKIVKAILKHEDANVFFLTWPAKISNSDKLMKKAKETGGHLTGFISEYLRKKEKINYISLITDHSGTFVVNYMSQTLKGKKVNRIMGLNQPQLDVPDKKSISDQYFLRKEMAEVVEAIHVYGEMGAFTHRDFYPNGGTTQPGCQADYEDNCNFKMIINYYAASITKKHLFKPTFCPSYHQYVQKKCEKNKKVELWNELSAKAAPIGRYFFTVKTKVEDDSGEEIELP